MGRPSKHLFSQQLTARANHFRCKVKSKQKTKGQQGRADKAAEGSGRDKFGAFIRRKREAKEIGLREMAKKIGVSPTYLSKVERDEFPPPTEDKVRKISVILDLDADELLARAGRVASDLTEIIRRLPRETASFLRSTSRLTPDEWRRLIEQARKVRNR